MERTLRGERAGQPAGPRRGQHQPHRHLPQTASATASWGVNTIGDIRLGGSVNGVATPTLVIEGLTTTADAFHTPQGFGHAESFDFASIRLELLAGTPLQGTPL